MLQSAKCNRQTVSAEVLSTGCVIAWATFFDYLVNTPCQPGSESVKYASAAGDAKRYQR